MHKYLFAHNDVLNKIDPSGEMAISLGDMNAAVGLAAIVGAAIVGISIQNAVSSGGGTRMLNQAQETINDLITAGERALSDLGHSLIMAKGKLATEIATAVARLAALGVVLANLPPIWPVPNALTPMIYANTVTWLGWTPRYSTLTYAGRTPGFATANRRRAIGGLGSAGTMRSWDEFPYASTVESTGTPVYTASVLAHENSVQGGLLKAFYYGVLKGTSQPFLVIPVP